MIPINADASGMVGTHPELFPSTEGKRTTISPILATATTAVSCPVCDAAAGEACVFPHTEYRNLRPGALHRQRLALDPADNLLRVSVVERERDEDDENLVRRVMQYALASGDTQLIVWANHVVRAIHDTKATP
jgi:hypothetical protein